ncbi:MAG: nuclear transport factor 2 family protein [Rubrivivax sp.]|nr:nuclear transport factor 2 family protein [Rubrivivax sp.]
MPRRPAHPVSGSADETEAQFYEALQKGDLERLMALWADDDEIVCVHPGGMRVVGPAAIRASFAAIFAQGGIPAVPEQVHRLALLGGALHHLIERITARGERGTVEQGFVLATNVYVKTGLGWRIAAHHASPAMPDDAQVLALTAGAEAPTTLH